MQIEIEQDILAELMLPANGAACLIHALEWRQVDSRRATADKHGRDGEMQTIQAAGVEEPRYRTPTAFDEDPCQPAFGQAIKHGRGCHVTDNQRVVVVVAVRCCHHA